jgi:hypothetical protein
VISSNGHDEQVMPLEPLDVSKMGLAERLSIAEVYRAAAEYGRRVDRSSELGRRCDELLARFQAELAAGMPNCHTDRERAWAKTLGFGPGTAHEAVIRGWLHDFKGDPFR